jgi:protein involved in polysaccharide export with SLBB domain
MTGIGTSACHHSATPVSASSTRGQPADESLTYTIGPGNVIQVLVWKEPDFSGNFEA